MRFLQKAVLPARESAWLTQGDELLVGYVVEAADGSWATTPEQLFRLHGLGFAGSPLRPDALFLDVIRFPITPFTRVVSATGGTTPEEARVTGGAFIDHPPFAGHGFVREATEHIVPLWWLDPVRVPAGSELWRIFADGHEELVAFYPHAADGWTATAGYAGAVRASGAPSLMLNVFGTWKGHRVVVDELRSGRLLVTSAEPLPGLSPSPRGLWAAEADPAEVSGIAMVRFTASWNGLPVQVLQRYADPQHGFLAHIVSLGRDAFRAEALGLTRTDAGVYEATVPWGSLTDVQGVELTVAPPAPAAPPEPEPAPEPEPEPEPASAAPAWVPVEQAAQALSPAALGLVDYGRDLWSRLAGEVPLSVIELAGGWGICLMHAVRGGGKIYIAPDRSALFAASAVAFDDGLAELYAGRRTPIEQFRGAQG